MREADAMLCKKGLGCTLVVPDGGVHTASRLVARVLLAQIQNKGKLQCSHDGTVVRGLSSLLIGLPASALPGAIRDGTTKTELSSFSFQPKRKSKVSFLKDSKYASGNCCRAAIELPARVFTKV